MVKLLSSYLFVLSISATCIHAMEQQKQLLEQRNGASWTPLHIAVSVGNQAGVEALLESGARIDSRALPYDRTPLMFSAEHNKVAIASTLLKKGAIVDQTDKGRMTALHIACQKGHCDMLEPLIMAGASVAATAAFDGMSAAFYAFAYKDHSDPSVIIALQKAVKKRQDTEAAAQGFALHRACQTDSIEEITKLLREGARIDELDKTGNSALHYAAANTNPEIIKAVLASVTKKEGETALPVSLPSASLAASQNGHPSTGGSF